MEKLNKKRGIFSVKLNKKGQVGIFSEMSGLAIGVTTVALVLVITFLMMAKTKEQIVETDGRDMDDSNGSMAWNATREMQSATFSLVGWIGLIIIVAIGILILGLVRQIRQA